ncbi:asparagine synthase-related protein [Bradyrhizobium sp. CCGUVB1N3]|uniref:asparagine synthase-related protein n=1 Tax=Bradyrhizobium sp. CCGUVB1N3 TaxID=2949629 RepID=UPI003531BCE1
MIESLSLLFGQLPGRFKVENDRRKIILRALAQRWLPPDFNSHRKQGFSLCTNGSRNLGNRSRTISSRPARHFSTNDYWRAFCQDCGRQSAEVTVYFSS